jgi:hypothetical protein
MITVVFDSNDISNDIRRDCVSDINIKFKSLEKEITEKNAFVKVSHVPPAFVSYELVTNNVTLLNKFEAIYKPPISE